MRFLTRFTPDWLLRRKLRPISGGGETVLTKLQAGLETVRGTPVVATRKLYGALTPHRDQPHRNAMEERGMFPDKYRANAKLVDASWSFKGDATPEDLPYFLDMMLKGGMTGVQLGTTGVYTWTCVPDQTVDALKTRTFEWGDDSLSYRGAFAVADQLDIAVPLDDALEMTAQGFVEEWVPVGNEGFTGFTGSISDRVVETMIGWQQRMFIDLGSGTVGTTWISNRFVSGNLTFKNQNKRKWFGDGSPRYTMLGRGRRQVEAAIVAEAFDLSIVGDIFNTAINKVTNNLPVERAVRLMLIGSPLGQVATMTAAPLAAGVITSIPTIALPAAIPGGMAISLTGIPFVVAPAGAAINAVTVPVISQTIAQAIPLSTPILACKQIIFDYWGYWAGNPNWGTRETNRTFQLTLDSLYDPTQAKEMQITVVNALPTASGIS